MADSPMQELSHNTLGGAVEDAAGAAKDNGTAKGPRKSISKMYQKMTQHEHVLKRPDTYIGSTEPRTDRMWVYDAETKGLKERDVTFVPGLYKIFDEILVNAADHKVRCPDMKKMEMTIDQATGTISVLNDGDGIPVELHKEHNCYVPELIFGHLLAGQNFDDSNKRLVGGRNGLGAKLANIWSKEFTVETAHEGKKFAMTWRDNMFFESSTKPKAKIGKSKSEFTKITFTPDLERFNLSSLDDDHVALFIKRAYDMAGVSDRSLSVKLNGERINVKDFKDYTKMYRNPEAEAEKVVYFSCDRWEIAVAKSDDQTFQQVSFVNSICTSKGGAHVDYIADQIVKHLVAVCKKKQKGFGLKGKQVKDHMKLFVNCKIENPTFSSQTKEEMTSKVSQFGSKCKLPLEDKKDKFVKDLDKCGVVQSLLFWADAKAREKMGKGQSGRKTSKLLGITKLDDANFAGTAKSKNCTLILTEGDSAKSLAVSGLGVIGRDYYGVFPLKGKLLNVRDATPQAVSKNEEITNLTKILGLRHGEKYTDTSKLRYGHVMIMTDQDHDGSHIKGLVVNWIHKFWPELLKLDSNFVQQFITPIVKATKGKKTEVFYTVPEYEAWKQSLDGAKGWKIKYYKGLGTSTSQEAKEYFAALEKSTINMVHSGDKCDDAIDLAFSKTKVEGRKNWMLRHNPETDFMDFAVDEVDFDTFVNKELILFSMADCQRSIPCVMDGFKPSQRKVLASVFKRKDLVKGEIKVAQLAGYVSEHMAYHHGEASLNGTIVNMAQNFCSSNNINFLVPSGQFGTRILGGKDAASPRYIFTKMAAITRFLFPEADDQLLKLQKEDGLDIEPQYYMPIIPTLLVNGADGIGTGWSSYVPNYNPRDIIANVRRVIAGEAQEDMVPFYRGFTGSITAKTGAKDLGNFLVQGAIEVVDDSTVHISELPLRMWTQTYKQFLETLLEGASSGDDKKKTAPKFRIKSFTENHTDTTVSFTVKMDPAELAKAEKEGLLKSFKLEGSISTQNMTCYDAKGRVTKYKSVTDIIEAFYDERMDMYDARKKHMLAELTQQCTRLSNQVRFIREICSGELVVSNRPKSELLAELSEKGYDTIVKDGKKKASEDEDEDDAEEDTGSLGKGYDYLLSMKIWSLTAEKAMKLEQSLAEIEAECDELRKKSGEDLWLADLDALEAALDADDAEEADLEREAEKLRKQAGGKAKKKPKKKPAKKWTKPMESDDDMMDDFDDGDDSDDDWGPAKPKAKNAPKQRKLLPSKPATSTTLAPPAATAAAAPSAPKPKPKVVRAPTIERQQSLVSDSDDESDAEDLASRIKSLAVSPAPVAPAPAARDEGAFEFDESNDVVEAEAPALTAAAVKAMKVPELKAELVKRALPKSGNKTVLTQRLLQACGLATVPAAVASPVPAVHTLKRKQEAGSGETPFGKRDKMVEDDNNNSDVEEEAASEAPSRRTGRNVQRQTYAVDSEDEFEFDDNESDFSDQGDSDSDFDE